MITFIYIIIILLIAFLINNAIHSFLKKKNPQLPEREIQKLLSPKVDVVMIILAISLIFGILYINFLYQTPSEKKELAEKEKSQKIELAKKDSLNKIEIEREKRPLNMKVAELYKKLHDNNDSSYYVEEISIKSFNSLLKEAKGTKYESKINKTIDSINSIVVKRNIAEEIQSRKKYGNDFQNLLLDKGLNIKVSVFGKNNKKMKLTYVLFTDVWFRKFETEGYFDMIHAKGFDYIELTDGYDYGRYMEY